MRVKALIISLLLLNVVAFSQSDVTLEETKEWIIDKVNKHSTFLQYKCGSECFESNSKFMLEDQDIYFNLIYKYHQSKSSSNIVSETFTGFNVQGKWKDVQIHLVNLNEEFYSKEFISLNSQCNILLKIFFNNRVTSYEEGELILSASGKPGTYPIRRTMNLNYINIPLNLDSDMVTRFNKALTHLKSFYTLKEKF